MKQPLLFAQGFFLLLFLSFYSCSGGRESVYSVDGKLISIDATQVAVVDPYIDSIIEIYRAPLIAEMNQVLAYSSQIMRKGTPEDLLNNFVADLVLARAQSLYKPDDGRSIDFCMLNYGGLRTSIPQGAVTRSRIFELMPFENEMVVLTITPENTRLLFEYIASRSVGTPVSGIQMGILDGKPHHVSIQGEPFDSTRSYKVVTSDFLAAAGDNMQFFLSPLNKEIIGMRIRDAIILHLQEQHAQGNMISSELDGRLYYVKQ